MHIFYFAETWQLTTLTAYADGTLSLAATDSTFSFAQVQNLFSSGTLASTAEGEFTIPQFATITASAQQQTSTEDTLEQLEDMLLQAKGEATSLAACQKRYVEYLIHPTAYNRNLLREAYEAVPESQRMFLGIWMIGTAIISPYKKARSLTA